MSIHWWQKISFFRFRGRKNRHFPQGRNHFSIAQIYSVFLVTILVAAALIGIRELGGLHSLESISLDRMVRLLPDKSPDPRLLVVEINEADIKKQGQWPFSDATIAAAIEKLQQYQPKVIGLDLYRNLSHPPGHVELARSFERANVITIYKVDGKTSQEIPPPSSISPDRTGFSDLVLDTDNVLRRNLLYAETETQKFYSFALRVSLSYLGNPPVRVTRQFLNIDRAIFPRLQANFGGYQMSPSETLGWQILLKYRSRDRVARKIAMTDLLNGNLDSSWIDGKVVLIGTTAPSAKDLFATPYSASETDNYLMPGVIVHAHMVSQILGTVLDAQQPVRSWSESVEWFWIWVWSLLGGAIAWRLNRPGVLGLAIGLGVGGLWGISLGLLLRGTWIPFVPPVLSFTIASGTVLAYKVFYDLYHDSLTGLPNRRSFIQRLNQINRQKQSRQALISVFLLDLDRFKRINEGLGRQAGNALLIESAKRLQKRLGRGEHLARVGEDEFGIWLDSIGNLHEATQIANQFQEELSQSFLWQEEEIFTNVSIGIACDRASKSFQADNLLRYAAIAMYRAKESGRPEIFISTMGKQAVWRWQLERDIRSAIKRQEFQIYYQPIVCLATGKIAGFEALVRWQCPRRGLVSPGDFIPLAEETGLILPLGSWILQESCRQMAEWQKRFPQDPPLTISVNLSGRQFVQADLVNKIQETVENIGIIPSSLKLEITETMMMQDMEGAISLLGQLKDLGIRLSIDDFGTGYSSLSYLHRLPIDSLKIDRSFVSCMEEADNSYKYTQIVSAIIMLGHNLGLDAIAEGIETTAQMQILKSLNCEYGQGYLFSKALPSPDIPELLARQA